MVVERLAQTLDLHIDLFFIGRKISVDEKLFLIRAGNNRRMKIRQRQQSMMNSIGLRFLPLLVFSLVFALLPPSSAQVGTQPLTCLLI